jgi:hypothetical protein
LIKKRYKKNAQLFFSFSILVIKTLDLDPDSVEMLDPDRDSMNPDPQH